jgi:putative membrane protein
MTMRVIAALATLAGAAFAAPVAAQAMAPARYLEAAGAADLYERAASQMVLESTTDPKVRDLARMMLADHARSSAALRVAAARAKVRVPMAALTPLQIELIAELRDETGLARDSTYIAQQRAAHGRALALHQAYAAGGSAAVLRAAAMRIAATVARHVEMLKAL